MKCGGLSRRLFQVLPTASHRRARRWHRPAFESLENKSLLSAFYVAPGGSDSANGSAQSPWASFQHAANVVNPGDIVHFAPGTYNSKHNPNHEKWNRQPANRIHLGYSMGCQTCDERQR